MYQFSFLPFGLEFYTIHVLFFWRTPPLWVGDMYRQRYAQVQLFFFVSCVESGSTGALEVDACFLSPRSELALRLTLCLRLAIAAQA